VEVVTDTDLTGRKMTMRLKEKVISRTKNYPELTPYQFASNSPIANIDLDGLEPTIPEVSPNSTELSETYVEPDGTLSSKNKSNSIQLAPIDVPPGGGASKVKGGYLITGVNGNTWFEPSKSPFGPQPPKPDFRSPLQKQFDKSTQEFQQIKNNIGGEKPTILPEIKPITTTLPPSLQMVSSSDDDNESGKVYLVRFGPPDDKERLKSQSAAAEKNPDFGHGVSTKMKRKVGGNERAALLSDVAKVFKVKKTGKDPTHYTVILPKPVNEEVTKKFNELFKTGN
jgi:hypothetical protein